MLSIRATLDEQVRRGARLELRYIPRVIWRIVLLIALLAPGQSHGFVFYRVAGHVLRWNVDSPGMHPNVVNPATKAIRYYIASDAYSSTNRQAEIDAIRAAFDQWQSVPGAKLRFEFAGLLPPDELDLRFDNTNVVFWAKKSLRVSAGLIDLDRRRAWTSPTYSINDGSILDADIVLNGIQYEWFTDFRKTNSLSQYVESTVLHEIGHFLGMDHSPAGGASVRNGAVGIASEAGLSADDIAGVRFLNPAPGTAWAAIQGTVRIDGTAVLGAVIVAEDAAGNIAGATVSDASGVYLLPSLPAGAYKLRASPLDPTSGLFRGEEIAPEYAQAVTSFRPTANFNLSLTAGQTATHDFDLVAGEPALRILGLSEPTPNESFVTFDRTAVSITQGQSNFFTGVISRGLRADCVLTVTGDGLTLGPSTFLENKFGLGIHAMLIKISVSSNATPGLRSYVITHPNGVAYANGYLEIAAATPDFNFDALHDDFQRTYWSPWTVAEAAPGIDADADLFSNNYEYRTGTNPLDPQSRVIRLDLPRPGRFGTTLSWQADAGKRYRLFVASGLGTDGAWQPASEIITATSEVVSFSEPGKSSARFYRLELVP